MGEAYPFDSRFRYMLCLSGPRACGGLRGNEGMARGRSLAEFQKAFADEVSCATFLFKRRWPDGFVRPACGRPPLRSSCSTPVDVLRIADETSRRSPAP